MVSSGYTALVALVATVDQGVVAGIVVFVVGMVVGLVSVFTVDRLVRKRMVMSHEEWQAAGCPERRHHERRRFFRSRREL